MTAKLRSRLLLIAALTGCGGDDRAGNEEPPACTEDRIRKLYAIPASLLVPQSTTIHVETHASKLEGEHRYRFAIASSDAALGKATLAPVEGCAEGAAACQAVRCVGVGKEPSIDEQSGLPVTYVRVEVTVEDEVCSQTEEIAVECLRASDEQTCNECMALIERDAAAALGSPCLSDAWLHGDAHTAGCFEDDVCFDLWSCYAQTLCHLPTISACYCGELEAPGTCLEHDFKARGPCHTEILFAFDAQLGALPRDNAEALRALFDITTAPTGVAPRSTATALATHCLRPSNEPAPTLSELLRESGVSEPAIDACELACFGPPASRPPKQPKWQ